MSGRWGGVVGLAGLLLVGCHADVAQLADDRAFDEAMCGAAHYSRHPERDLELVGRALDAAARPRVHLATLSREQLTISYGDTGGHVADQVVVVRGVFGIDEVGVSDFGLAMTLHVGASELPQLQPDRETLLALTGERMPASEITSVPSRRRFVAERWAQRPLMGLLAGTLEASTVFLVPVTEMTGHTRRSGGYVIETPPSDEEVLAAAPVAESLRMSAVVQSVDTYELGSEVADVWMWPRPVDERAPMSLELVWGYEQRGCAPRGPRLKRTSTASAHVERRARIPLPPGPTLEARLDALFGDRMLPLERLAKSPS